LHQALPVFLDHRSGQFLDEERHTAGAIDHRIDGIACEYRTSRDLFHQGAGFAAAERAQRQMRMMRAQRPGNAKFCAVGE
jgi:hypothetical protein